MTPDMAAEAMRAYAEETNRLNRTRRLSANTNRRDLAETEKAIHEIVRIIEQGGWHRALSERLTELEAKQDDLTARLSQASVDMPDLHPGIGETYRRRIGRLTEALAHPDDALEAADALREVIDRIVLTPGDRRGQLRITLQGEFGTILDWIERTGKPGYRPDPDTATSHCQPRSKRGDAPGLPRVQAATREEPDAPRRGHPGFRSRVTTIDRETPMLPKSSPWPISISSFPVPRR